MRKAYVSVTVTFDIEGNITPHSINWEDGTVYEIDKILDIKPRASIVGGLGTRYKCRIDNQDAYLFLEDNRWFVEAKQ